MRIGDRLLPLAMVSPEEIRAQLPSDIEVGRQTLAVRWSNKPEVTAEFEVVRNAPGLFFEDLEGRQFAVAIRENGNPIKPGDTVKPGEVLTLFGDGFRPVPYDSARRLRSPGSLGIPFGGPGGTSVGRDGCGSDLRRFGYSERWFQCGPFSCSRTWHSRRAAGDGQGKRSARKFGAAEY